MDSDVLYWSVPGALAAAAAVGLAVPAVVPAWDDLARRRISELEPQLRSLGLNTARLTRWMELWGLAMVGVFVVLWVAFGMPLVAAVAVAVVYASPTYLIKFQIARRRSLMRDQMASASVSLSNAVRAGMSLPQGIASVSRDTPEPLAAEFRRLIGEYERGRPLTEAITASKERLNLDSFTVFASAVLACLDRGGRVTEALEGISRSLLENQRLERKLEADTASGRKVMLILGLFPFLFLGGIYSSDPEQTAILFQTIPGQVVLVAVVALVAVAMKISQKILDIDI